MPYRAGYTPAQRRDVEGRLSARRAARGRHDDALELGIDVGALDASIVVTFPGTIASLRQMWGRAGRRRRGLALYVAGEDALDQFFARHTEDFLDRPGRVGDPRPRVRGDPPRAPAVRRPRGAARRAADAEFFGPPHARVPRAARGRSASCAPRDGHLRAAPPRALPGAPRSRCARRRPARSRSSTARPARCSGSTETARACSTLHPGAVYLHLGRSYHVGELDLDARRAVVEPVRRRLVHAAQARDRDADRAPARPPRGARRGRCRSAASRSPRPCSPTSAAGSPTTARST